MMLFFIYLPEKWFAEKINMNEIIAGTNAYFEVISTTYCLDSLKSMEERRAKYVELKEHYIKK